MYLTRTKTTKFKIQTATLLSRKGSCGVGFFAQLPVECSVLQSAATGEGPAISSTCFSPLVALPGNHGAGMGLARRRGGSTELGESTVA